MNSSDMTWRLYCDGAARGNPGPAGIGICLIDPAGEYVVRAGYWLGHHTNNYAEYMAMYVGLVYVDRHVASHASLSLFSDSQLLVRQVRGEYRVRNAELKMLHARVCARLADRQWNIYHVPRSMNKDADALANAGIDQGCALPADIVHELPSR